MALLGDGLLAIWNDIDPALEAEFTHWYLSEHFAERVGIPGFLRARRYVAAAPGPGPEYAALYETETADVLASPAYIARLNDPTPLTTRMLAQFRNTIRSVGPVAAILTIRELNIGHFLIGESIFGGLESSIKRMRALMDKSRAEAGGERSA